MRTIRATICRYVPTTDAHTALQIAGSPHRRVPLFASQAYHIHGDRLDKRFPLPSGSIQYAAFHALLFRALLPFTSFATIAHQQLIDMIGFQLLALTIAFIPPRAARANAPGPHYGRGYATCVRPRSDQLLNSRICWFRHSLAIARPPRPTFRIAARIPAGGIGSLLSIPALIRQPAGIRWPPASPGIAAPLAHRGPARTAALPPVSSPAFAFNRHRLSPGYSHPPIFILLAQAAPPRIRFAGVSPGRAPQPGHIIGRRNKRAGVYYSFNIIPGRAATQTGNAHSR